MFQELGQLSRQSSRLLSTLTYNGPLIYNDPLVILCVCYLLNQATSHAPAGVMLTSDLVSLSTWLSHMHYSSILDVLMDSDAMASRVLCLNLCTTQIRNV